MPAFLAVGFGIATLGAFTISATIGLYGVHEQWVGAPVWSCAIAEVVAIVAGGAALAQSLPSRSGRRLRESEAR